MGSIFRIPEPFRRALCGLKVWLKCCPTPVARSGSKVGWKLISKSSATVASAAPRYHIDAPFDLFYRPAGEAALEEEMAIDEGEAEMGFYEMPGLELEDILREQVLLQLPMQRFAAEPAKESVRSAAPTAMKWNATARPIRPTTAGAALKASAFSIPVQSI